MVGYATRFSVAATAICLVAGCLPDRLDDEDLTEQISAAQASAPGCADYADCVLGCGDDEACKETCHGKASEDAQWKGDEVLSCYTKRCAEKTCAGSNDPQCRARCVMLECAETLLVCLDTPLTGPDNCGGALEEMFACDLASGEGWRCLSDRYRALTKESQELMQDLGSCTTLAVNKGADPMQICIDPELGRCMGAGVADPGDCYPVFACFDSCGEASEAGLCTAKCLGTMSEAGWEAYNGLKDCGVFGGDAGEQACKEAMVACAAPGGSESCMNTAVCGQGCDTGGGSDGERLSCLLNCAHQSSEESAALYIDVIYCTAACEERPACFPKTKCAKATNACLADK